MSIEGAGRDAGRRTDMMGPVLHGIAVAAVAISAVAWLALALPMLRGNRRIRGLGSAPERPAAALPSLTIISAARDEAARIESAVQSLLGQDYPGFELIVVDDRSTDGTGALLDRAAAADARLRVAHVTDLPPGWLGKCHALALASREARSEWLLFTDGDVWMAPDAARRAVSLAQAIGADHLAVNAELEDHTFGERIFIGYFSAMFYASQKPWDAPNPRSSAHVGIGAFNLVRRDVYERAGGHERLRLEIVDDMALGLIVKQSGGRSHFAFHDGYVRVRWHVGVRGLVRGIEKNSFAALHFSTGETILAVSFQFLGTLAPFAGWFLAGVWPKVFAAAGCLGLALLYRGVSRNMRLGWWDVLFAPVGGALFSYAILRSMTLTLKRGGVVWRGTYYDLETLRKGQVRSRVAMRRSPASATQRRR